MKTNVLVFVWFGLCYGDDGDCVCFILHVFDSFR